MDDTRIQLPTTNAENILLVEGQDDRHVIKHICWKCQPLPRFHIEDKGGAGKLISGISGEIKVSGRKALGIVVDADGDPQSRWAQVVKQLDEQDIHCPVNPDP